MKNNDIIKSTKTREELRAYAANLEFNERQKLIARLSPLFHLTDNLIKNIESGVYDEIFPDNLQRKKFLFRYLKSIVRNAIDAERQMKVWYFVNASKKRIEKGGEQ